MVGSRPPAKQLGESDGRKQNENIDWYLWTAVLGVPDIAPPLCSWDDLKRPGYTLSDIEIYHQVLDELITARRKAMANI